MPAANLGYSGVLYTDRRRFYPSPQMVAQLYAPQTPFLSTVMARQAMSGGGRMVEDKSYKLFEHRQHWRYMEADIDTVHSQWSGSNTPGETATISLKNLEGIKENPSLVSMTFDIWSNDETTHKGQARVDSFDTNNNRLTLKAIAKPESSDFSLDDLSADDHIYIVSSAHGEGADAPEAYSDELDVVWNSVQRERTAVEITEDLRRAVLRGERQELARLRNTKQNEHKVKNSRNLLMGVRVGGIGGTAHRAGGTNDNNFLNDNSGDPLHITDADGNRVTTTMGWISVMQRYGQDSDSALKQNWFDRDARTYGFGQFIEDSQKIAQYADRQVVNAYCGGAVMSFWSKRALDNSNWNVQISGFRRSRLGFFFRILETPHLTLRLIKEPTLRGTPHESKMMMPSLEHVGTARYAPDTYETDIKRDNNPDIQKDEITSWKGLSMQLPERHFLINFQNLLNNV